MNEMGLFDVLLAKYTGGGGGGESVKTITATNAGENSGWINAPILKERNGEIWTRCDGIEILPGESETIFFSGEGIYFIMPLENETDTITLDGAAEIYSQGTDLIVVLATGDFSFEVSNA